MDLSPAQLAVLNHIAEPRVDMLTGRVNRLDIRRISEPYRQRAIDLAMMEPPLVDIEGDFLFVTDFGLERLRVESQLGARRRWAKVGSVK